MYVDIISNRSRKDKERKNVPGLNKFEMERNLTKRTEQIVSEKCILTDGIHT